MRRLDGDRRTLVGLALAIGFLASPAMADDPRPAPLARYFPKKDLIAYVEFDGIDAHAPAWNRTAAARILNETPTGTMLASVARQLLEMLIEIDGDKQQLAAPEIAGLVEHLARSGFAFAINRKPDDPTAKPSSIGLVVRGAGRGPTFATFQRILKLPGIAGAITTLDRPGGRKVSVIGSQEPDGPCVAWWSEKDDLAVAILRAPYVDKMIDVIEGREPNAVDHAVRAELAATTDGFEPVGFAFFDPTALPELPPEAVVFGLNGIKRLDFRWGYQGEALMTDTRIHVPAPRSGVLAMFDQPTFDARTLPPLPAGVGAFGVASIDLVKLHDQLAALVKLVTPKGQDPFARTAESFKATTGRRLREDVLARIGPKVVFADVPIPVLVTANKLDSFAQGLARVPRTSLLIEFSDREKVLADLDALATWANGQFPIARDPNARADRPSASLVRRLKGDGVGYEIALSPTYLPLPAGFRPSVVVGDRYVSIGTSPDVARRALKPDGEVNRPLARAIAGIPGDLTILSVADTQNSPLPEVIANIPSMIQSWMFLFQGVKVTTVVVPDGAPQPPPPANEIKYRLRLDPDEIPTPEEIRPFLFPNTYTMSVDAKGFRIVTRESMPSWNPIALAPLLIASALPAFEEWRENAEKERLSANLKQVGIGLQNYHSAHDRFPPPAIVSKDGQPLLSWRVAILPELGLKSLHDEFHKDEPWDSPHNKALLGRMPAAFLHPDAPAPEGSTFYRGLVGEGAFFDPSVKEGIRIADITDGTWNTIAVVEAREAVPWTRPGTDLPIEPIQPGQPRPSQLLPLLGGHTPGGFQALFVDGSVRFIRETVSVVVLQSLVTRNGGEVIASDAF